MADSRILLEGLREYRDCLSRHLGELNAEFQELESGWQALDGVFHGDAADEFRFGWHRTVAGFREYLERGGSVLHELQDRIAGLESANTGEGLGS
jgi:uncharacterized protein YukE